MPDTAVGILYLGIIGVTEKESPRVSRIIKQQKNRAYEYADKLYTWYHQQITRS